MWSIGKPDLLRNDIDGDPVPDATSKRWGVSAILRLPAPFGESLDGLLTQLRAYTGEGHTFYNPMTFHITLRSIEYFREPITPDDRWVNIYRQLMRQLTPNALDLSIRFAGLSANRVGVILQGFPATDQLQALREQFHELLAHHELLQGPEQNQPRINAHASLIVYGTSRLAKPEALVDYIEQHRSTDYGQVNPISLELVRYEKRPESVTIVTLERLTLT
ncbi:hypothetical protein CWM47_35530 [Spirosoma pollinicola]|uniref:2'-5' RNA ligase n=2 Tax=Spirosoma pollinicola TaxID=2057025 RepID=A0A2K8ZA27_9BACT|nr:hypothetical protein CWM47_35530 [Spirosoma pollinicola]